jgi:hypothetical protein
MSCLVPQHQSRQSLLKWLNSLELRAPVDSFTDLMSGESLCLVLSQLFPNELKPNQITKDAQLNYDRRKNFKLLHKICSKYSIAKSINVENIVECNNVVQLVELVKLIHAYYMENFFILQHNNELKRANQRALDNRNQIIQTLSNERNQYFSKLRSIEDELNKCIRHNQQMMKPHERHEKLVYDSLISILSERSK